MRAVQAYRILPGGLTGPVGHGLPVLEIVVGLLLILGMWTRLTAAVGLLLMVAFLAGISQAWARGLSIDCGCFGGGGLVAASRTRYPLELARDTGLALGGVWLVWRPRTLLALGGP